MLSLRLYANPCVINYEDSQKDKFPFFEEFPIYNKKIEMKKRNEWQIWKAALKVH